MLRHIFIVTRVIRFPPYVHNYYLAETMSQGTNIYFYSLLNTHSKNSHKCKLHYVSQWINIFKIYIA